MKIIVTRPEPDASAFAELARAGGFEPVISPVMTIVFNRTPPRLDGVGALAFTSANGVRAFIAAANGPSALPIFAVGGITAAEAVRLGFTNVAAAGGDAANLADMIAAAYAEGSFTGTVLHIGGANRAGDLVGALIGLGVKAELAALYEAVPAASLGEAAAALAAAPPADSVALFSPRSAKVFIGLVRKTGLEARLGGVIAACLSEAVADAASVVSWRRIIVADERTGDSLLSTLLREIGGRSG